MTGKNVGQSSVILKRQVLIRFDEVPTSWLGGLPMMPAQTPWPRGKDGAPLHFLGQIACASLPPNLSRGLARRKGWLLLFINVLTVEDKATHGDVQVIHVRKAGPEREPPDDTPCVRHTMSDYIDYAKANIRPGVPKMWRKWPVDLVVQAAGAPTPTGEEMYGAATDSSTINRMVTGVDRPLRWLGALYSVEGILRKLDPVAFARDSILSDQPPETNQAAFHAEYERRAALRSDELSDRAVGWGPRVNAVREAINAEIRKDRRVGWFAEGVAQNRQRAADFAAKLADAQ
jgi:hypothetical protein